MEIVAVLCQKSSQGGGRMRKFITCIRSYYRKKISRLVTSRKMLEITTMVLVLRNTQRVKFLRKRMNKKRGQASGRGVVQEFSMIALSPPDLEYKLAKVGYLCRFGHEAHSLWDVISTARV